MDIDLEDIISITELKTHPQPLSNSDYILAIIEICLNSSKYQLKYSNSTRNFWDAVIENEILSPWWKAFKSETLRKYWRILRDINQNEKVVALIRENKEIINNPLYKLLPIINLISGFIKTKSKNFPKYIQENSHSISNKPKTESKPEAKAKPSPNMWQQKRKNNKIGKDIIEDIEKLNKITSQKKESSNEIEKNKWIEEDSAIVDIDKIIKAISNQLPRLSKEEIFNVWYKTSGNIRHAFFYWKYEEEYLNLLFEETDDYIIKNLRDQKYYKELAELKGKQLVNEREMFLEIGNTTKTVE